MVAPLSVTKLSHVLPKWLHHLEEDQNVTLLHWAESWHDWEHAARLSRVPDPLFKYPLFATSHALSEIVRVFTVLVAAGVVGLFPDLNVTVIAPLSVTKLSHVLLK